MAKNYKLLAGLLIAFALSITPAYAAINYLPPERPQGCPVPDLCPGVNYCYDANTLTVHAVYLVDNTTTTITENMACNNGCSNALSDCRPDRLTELAIFFMLTIGLALLVYVAYNYVPSAGIFFGFIVMLMLITFATLDIFSSGYKFLLVLWIVAYIGFMIVLFQKRGRLEREREEEESEVV